MPSRRSLGTGPKAAKTGMGGDASRSGPLRATRQAGSAPAVRQVQVGESRDRPRGSNQASKRTQLSSLSLLCHNRSYWLPLGTPHLRSRQVHNSRYVVLPPSA